MMPTVAIGLKVINEQDIIARMQDTKKYSFNNNIVLYLSNHPTNTVISDAFNRFKTIK